MIPRRSARIRSGATPNTRLDSITSTIRDIRRTNKKITRKTATLASKTSIKIPRKRKSKQLITSTAITTPVVATNSLSDTVLASGIRNGTNEGYGDSAVDKTLYCKSRLPTSNVLLNIVVPVQEDSTANQQKSSTATTAKSTSMLDDACAHLLKVDAGLKSLVEKHRCRLFTPEGLAEVVDPWECLTGGIIAQQVSGAASESIKKRFISLFPNTSPSFPDPKAVAVAPIDSLRTAGLSSRKAEYIKGLASKFATGELSGPMLANAKDEELMEKLVSVRGLGKWSVEMFAMFGLKRWDVFSTGDLGVQRGMAAYAGKDVGKLKSKGGTGKWKYMSEMEMEQMAKKFVPYRSLFMWYMWKMQDVNIRALAGPNT